MSAISFEWSTRQLPDGRWLVRETALSSGDYRDYGPMEGRFVESFIRARRESVYRRAVAHGAIKILTH